MEEYIGKKKGGGGMLGKLAKVVGKTAKKLEKKIKIKAAKKQQKKQVKKTGKREKQLRRAEKGGASETEIEDLKKKIETKKVKAEGFRATKRTLKGKVGKSPESDTTPTQTPPPPPETVIPGDDGNGSSSYIGTEYGSDSYLYNKRRRRSEQTRIRNKQIKELTDENEEIQSVIGEIVSIESQCTNSAERKECALAMKIFQQHIYHNQLKIKCKMCKEENKKINDEYKEAIVDYKSKQQIDQKIISVLNFNTGGITKEIFG